MDYKAIEKGIRGFGRHPQECAKNVKMCGGKIIAITKYGTSKLSSISDYNLFAPALEKPLRTGASSGRVSQLAVVDIVNNKRKVLVSAGGKRIW